MTRLFSFFILLAVLGGISVATEEPEYEVVKEFEGIEIREYTPMVVAETEVEGDFDEVGNDAFRILADYIFGNNNGEVEIEMTAPVSQKPMPEIAEASPSITLVSNVEGSESASTYSVTFTMPSSFTLETLPDPTDDRVKLRHVPKKLMAVRKYSGSWSESKYRKHEQKLFEGLQEAGYEMIGEAIFARYNAPFTIPMLRRNEVMVEVNESPDVEFSQ